MRKLYEALLEELKAGRGAVLCSIVASSGSTPRGAGAKMLVLEDGKTLGTIGGGAVELRASQAAHALCRAGQSRFERYRLSPNEIADIGMICGGDVQVYFQYFDPASPDQRALAEDILRALGGKERAWLVTAVEDGTWRSAVCPADPGGLETVCQIPFAELSPLLGSRPALREGRPTLYTEPLGRAGTVYLFGAGHVGLALARVLDFAGFRVAAYDQREHTGPIPGAEAVFHGPYTRALELLPPISGEDYVVIMTPGHQGDYEVLSQVLRTPAKYIGCIGSRRKVAVTRERLLADGFTQSDVDRVCAPIGLDIGGETPEEIAVSVAAQMIACRSRKLPQGGRGL